MGARTLRTRLTVLYAGPFLLSSAILLSIPLVQTDRTLVRPAGLPGDPGPAAPPAVDFSPLFAASVLGWAAMALVAVVVGWLIAGRFLRPLRTIIAAARDISARNLHRRLGVTGRDDEFTELARTLDDLFERLQAAFVSQRHFVANAAHELRTPLTAERTLLQVALADPDASIETLRSACQDVLALSATQERLIDALLTLASSEQGIEHPELLDLADIAAAVVMARHPQALRRGIRVHADLTAAPAMGDPRLAEILVTNLVENAVRHNVSDGMVELTTTVGDGRARIRVRNTGPTVAPADIVHAFQPFRRVGRQRVKHTDGHGLGLAIVAAIANAHGATINASARPQGGLDIEVSFPGPTNTAADTGPVLSARSS